MLTRQIETNKSPLWRRLALVFVEFVLTLCPTLRVWKQPPIISSPSTHIFISSPVTIVKGLPFVLQPADWQNIFVIFYLITSSKFIKKTMKIKLTVKSQPINNNWQTTSINSMAKQCSNNTPTEAAYALTSIQQERHRACRAKLTR